MTITTREHAPATLPGIATTGDPRVNVPAIMAVSGAGVALTMNESPATVARALSNRIGRGDWVAYLAPVVAVA